MARRIEGPKHPRHPPPLQQYRRAIRAERSRSAVGGRCGYGLRQARFAPQSLFREMWRAKEADSQYSRKRSRAASQLLRTESKAGPSHLRRQTSDMAQYGRSILNLRRETPAPDERPECSSRPELAAEKHPA